MKKFSFKIYNGDDVLLAIADKDIVGKTFCEDGFELDVSKEFYHQDFCNEEQALDLVEKSIIVNAIGNNITDLLVKKNIVDKTNVLVLCGISHAQIITV